ncbi:hypothetical protein AWV80_10595 [Cupriavidus sp. UYMU48A]|nr:hypothetical protein AWV80_10595 [Cupriavidus sp. UYMU48A]
MQQAEPQARGGLPAEEVGSAVQEYRSSNGSIRATLDERADGIVLNIQGAEGGELSAIVQSLRHLLASMVH